MQYDFDNPDPNSPFNLGSLGQRAVQQSAFGPDFDAAEPSSLPGYDAGLGIPNIAKGTMGANGLKLGLGAIQTLGSLWNSFQQNKLAAKSLKMQEKAYGDNLFNQRQSYDTALEDRIRSRYVTENKTSAQADSYIEKHKLS